MNILTKVLTKNHVLTFLLATVLVGLSLHGAHASIAGDDVCGGASTPKCGPQHIKIIATGILRTIITLGLPILTVFVVWRFVDAWFKLRSGNAGAYKEALKRATQAITGFLIILALFGGALYALLTYVGVKGEGSSDINPLRLLKLISEAFMSGVMPHVYAADVRLLPNPLTQNDLYTFLMSAVRAAIRFFLYPAVVIMWVWSGFQFVYAQGNPEGLKKARSWLLWAVVTTLVMFTIQGFLMALQASAQKILPSTATPITNTNGTPDGRGQPADGATNSQCTRPDGTYGIMDVNSVCQPGRGSSYTTPTATASACKNADGTNKPRGTMCTAAGRPGTCSVNTDDVFGCYVATIGDTCITQAGTPGVISNSQGVCTAVAYAASTGNAAYDRCIANGGGVAECRQLTAYRDSCLEAGTQLNAVCNVADGSAGWCKFNINTNQFVCVKRSY